MNAKKDSGRKKTQKSGMGRSALRLLVSLAAGGAAGCMRRTETFLKEGQGRLSAKGREPE